LIELAEEDSVLGEPAERLWEAAFMDKLQLRVGQLARNVFVVFGFLWNIQVGVEDVLQWLRSLINDSKHLMELVETIDRRHQHDKVVCLGCSIEANSSDGTVLAAANIKDLKTEIAMVRLE
jgi:hypothetical protein